jgi:hypothetical protein
MCLYTEGERKEGIPMEPYILTQVSKVLLQAECRQITTADRRGKTRRHLFMGWIRKLMNWCLNASIALAERMEKRGSICYW